MKIALNAHDNISSWNVWLIEFLHLLLRASHVLIALLVFMTFSFQMIYVHMGKRHTTN